MKKKSFIPFVLIFLMIAFYSCKKETTLLFENSTTSTEQKEIEKILSKSGFKKLEKNSTVYRKYNKVGTHRSLTLSEIKAMRSFAPDPLLEPEIEEYASMSSPETMTYSNRYHFAGLQARGYPSIFVFYVQSSGPNNFTVANSDFLYIGIGSLPPAGSAFAYSHMSGEASSTVSAAIFGTLVEVVESAGVAYYRNYEVTFNGTPQMAYIKIRFIG